MMNINKEKQQIQRGETALGIELGSTCIKAVLLSNDFQLLGSGEHLWANKFENGLWTYSLTDIHDGIKACYAALKKDIARKYGTKLTTIGSMGVSAMMHGYMVFDKSGKLLVPFRTWRNNNAEKAARELSKLFDFNIPARWSISHLYQAIMDKEPHIKDIAFQTTLEGYVHYLLTGQKVIGIGEASGMFPVTNGSYDKAMITKFQQLDAVKATGINLTDIFPKILYAGQSAGSLTADGAKFLDAEGDLKSGIPLCPPEGDAGTGMVSTNSVRPRTGNISAGTSVFGMVVLDHAIGAHPEIDIVTTPSGEYVAMVHCNNCSSEINEWVGVLNETLELFDVKADKNELYSKLFLSALDGSADAGGLVVSNYLSGENITGVDSGCLFVARGTDGKLNLSNFIKAQLYASIVTLKIGLDILFKKESVKVDTMFGHGGIFRTKGVFQRYLAAAVNAPVSVTDAGGMGGAWGMAVLALYMSQGGSQSLADYLDNVVFAGGEYTTVYPDKSDVDGLDEFTARFVGALPHMRSNNKQETDKLSALKEKVFKANLQLVKNGLVLYTWGNVSEIDRESGLVVIKPSGVDYDSMTADDMVVVDLNGNVVDGNLSPSSDTPTHLELYKAHPEIGGIVHTHSTYATAFAQACKGISAYGTTHADYFYGEIPCARPLSADEVQSCYEKNTGKVINETLNGKDALEVPAMLVSNHGPFAWGKDSGNAVYNATVLEEVAKMAYITETLGAKKSVPKYLLNKHYTRKHGKNAYYGQKKEQ